MSTQGHIKSAWKDPVGKPLTDAMIRRYERLGFYGHEKEVTAANGIIHRCRECDIKKRVVYYKFKYLPTPGFYCPSCLDVHRAEHNKAKHEKEQWHALMEKEYV